jgi:putative tricarboxylic transport membrane protein
MFVEHERLVSGIYGTMLVTAVIMLAVGRIGLVGFAQLTRVPATVIIPIVTVLCLLGAYLESRSLFAVHLTIAFAILGYLMHRFDYSRVTFLIGFVIGPQFELSLRQSIIISGGDITVVVQHPLAMAIVAITIGAGLYFMRAPRK